MVLVCRLISIRPGVTDAFALGMKTTLIHNEPRCAAHSIGSHEPDWQQRLRAFIEERKTIAFHLDDMDAVLGICESLNLNGYQHCILSWNCRRHFLVPSI